jgi:purine-binding chemotaxis protein CheW
LDGQRYAVQLKVVERIVNAVEVTPLPNAPAPVLGVINVGGQLLPVFNLRRRFDLPIREIGPRDHFVIARTALRLVALAVDEVQEVVTRADIKITPSEEIVGGVECIQGIARLEDGLVLIYDLEKFLSLEESRTLESALSKEVASEVG